MKVSRVISRVEIGAGLLLFLGGLYILPVGTDLYLWFFVTVICGGNWFWGSILANLTAIAMIVTGVLILRHKRVIRRKRNVRSVVRNAKRRWST